MMFRRIHKNIRNAAETVLTLVLVLVFFSMLLFLLDVIFPSGSKLYTAITNQESNSQVGLLGRALRNLLLIEGEKEIDMENDDTLVAVLTKVKNNVKSKRARAIAWSSADEKTQLFNRDAIQTLSRSNALITFESGNTIFMEERSVVVVRQLDDDHLLGEKRSVVVLVDGELRGRINKGDQQAIYMEVATPGATVRVQTGRHKAAASEFKVKINADKSSTVTVLEGQADITAQGKMITLSSNQSTLVPLYQPPLLPVALPEPVRLDSPKDSQVFYYHRLPPKIRFTWQDRPEFNSYKFILARDRELQQIVSADRIDKPLASHGNLKSGMYFWQIEAQGPYRDRITSDVRCFRVVEDVDAPALTVRFPDEAVHSNFYTLKGKTEPGAAVFIDGKRIAVSASGEFRHRLELQRGINLVLVEAVDKADNLSYRSNTIQGKF